MSGSPPRCAGLAGQAPLTCEEVQQARRRQGESAACGGASDDRGSGEED